MKIDQRHLCGDRLYALCRSLSFVKNKTAHVIRRDVTRFKYDSTRNGSAAKGKKKTKTKNMVANKRSYRAAWV